MPMNPSVFKCLNGNDVITANISDHHPIIHRDTIFWNVMMQGKMRTGKEGISYNNGFGVIETDRQYENRIAKVAKVIAEIVYHHPHIEMIGLCEGPIQSKQVNDFIHQLKKFKWMERFFIQHQPGMESFPNWGLFMLADKKYKLTEIKFDVILPRDIFAKLANRFQLWKLTLNQQEKYFALGHFPFGGDEHVTEKNKLSYFGNSYCHFINDLLKQYANKDFILCADFNFNPYLIQHWKDRGLDQITHHNSILLTTEENQNKRINTVTVDGILLSQKEKQIRYHSQPQPRLMKMLTNEYGLFSQHKKYHVNRKQIAFEEKRCYK